MSGVLLAHPTLNENVRETALALADGGLLGELHTSVAVGPRAARVAGALPRVGGVLERRRVPDATAGFAHSHPLPELRRLAGRRLPRRLLGERSLHDMYAAMDRIVARRVRPGLRAVYGYEDGALDTFAAAATLGVPRLYDLPIPYWRMKHALLEEEAERNPAWAPLLGGLTDPGWVIERKTAELAAADLVVTASSLSTASVRGERPDAPLVQIAYGCPTPAADVRPSRGGPVRVLYVGSLTQRKGLSYVFDAMATLGQAATLTVVGSGAPADSELLQNALAAHTHIPAVPHHRMAETMREHDVLLLPSLVEGFGLVITEALAQGVPVVATDRTGAVDLYGPEERGWLVPPADADAIAAVLAGWAADTDALNAAKLGALEVARRNPWSTYRERVLQAVRDATA